MLNDLWFKRGLGNFSVNVWFQPLRCKPLDTQRQAFVCLVLRKSAKRVAYIPDTNAGHVVGVAFVFSFNIV